MAIILWIGLTVLSIVISVVLTMFKLIPKWVFKVIIIAAAIFAIRNGTVMISTYSKIKQYYELTQVKVETIKNDAEKYQEYLEDVKATNEWVKSMKEKVNSSAPIFFRDKLEDLKEIKY